MISILNTFTVQTGVNMLTYLIHINNLNITVKNITTFSVRCAFRLFTINFHIICICIQHFFYDILLTAAAFFTCSVLACSRAFFKTLIFCTCFANFRPFRKIENAIFYHNGTDGLIGLKNSTAKDYFFFKFSS